MSLDIISGINIFLQVHGYLLLFLLMVIEGPVVTSVAGFAASLGYIDLFLVIVLAFFGNLIPDTLLFLIGKIGRKKIILKLVYKLGLNTSRIKRIENILMKHSIKALIFIKISPLLPLPGLILAGFVKMPLRKFILIDAIYNILAAIIFTLIGFYFGLTIGTILKYFRIGQYALLVLIPLVFFFYFMYKKICAKIQKIKF